MPYSLPAGIENYLKDSGFSEREISVVKLILENGSETSSAISKKIGISPLDTEKIIQSLVKKNLIVRGSINRQSRYSIQSLDKIVNWVKLDMDLQNSKEKIEKKFDKDLPRDFKGRKFFYEKLLPIVLACIVFFMLSMIIGLYKMKLGFFQVS